MDNNTFSERLMGLQSNLLNFAYTLTLNRDDAQDLLQDTTLKALDNQDKYVDNVNFKGWRLLSLGFTGASHCAAVCLASGNCSVNTR